MSVLYQCSQFFIYIYIYIYHYYKLQKHNSTYYIKDHLLLIHHCNLHNHYQNHKRTIFEYNCHYYIEIGHYGTIFLNIRQNQLKTTKQIYWIPEILPYYSAKAKNPVFYVSFFICDCCNCYFLLHDCSRLLILSYRKIIVK